MKKKVFISYSHQDVEYAKKIAKSLAGSGLAVWTTQKIEPGMELTKAIQKSLDESSAVLVLLSENWEHSKWAAFELGAAYAKGKKIIPIVLSKQFKSIPLMLSQFKYLDATNLDESTFAKKIEEIIEHA